MLCQAGGKGVKMSLTIDNHQKTTGLDAKTAEVVAAYVNGLYYATNGVPRDLRDAAADAYMKDNPLKVDDKAAAVKEIDALTRECEDETKSASWRTKLQYEYGRKGERIAKLAMLGAATAVGSVLAANGMPLASSSVLFAGLVAIQGGNTPTDREKADIERYGVIKHGQFVLKKMKRALTSEDDKENASAVKRKTVLNLKRNGGR